ncbi:hypothetical protein LSAT2_023595 [Lamellibrachia satsuma]|nr:hypothetical protein LSAT2_023595 [Lamellibrachia satsuma]
MHVQLSVTCVAGLLLLVVVSVCGAEVKVSCKPQFNETVISPGYPNAYPANMSCTWVLPNATYMVLDEFYLQPGDVLVFYEGAAKKGNIIANLTGKQDKLVVYSASENTTVFFKSKAKSGLASSRIRCFKLTYSLLAPHQKLTGNSGQIQSPVYKTGNGTVEWFYELNGLKRSTRGKVSLSADVVDIKHGSLVILSGDNSTLVNRTGRVNHLGDVFAKTLKMYVNLTLSTSVQQKFSAAFTSTTAACTKTVKLTSQKIFSSPGYPSNYSGDLNCRWVIQSPPNTTIKVQFSDFRLADSYDQVILVDGDAKEDRSFGVYSHLNPPGSNFFLTSSNSLWLHFGTDESESAAGFNLTLEPVAHGGRFVDKGIISLDLTDDVESSEPVYFQLTVKDGQQVYLNFTNMWLGNSTATVTCYNSLSEDGAAIIARFSAASGPPSLPVYSSDNHMLVVASDFFINNSLIEVMPHFTASFKAVPQGQSLCCSNWVDFVKSGCEKSWAEVQADSFSFECRGCKKMKELEVELEELRLLVVAMMGREHWSCASSSGGGTVDDKVGKDTRDARESSPQPGRKLRGGKVTGHRETGRKETGRKGTGGTTTGVKERGVGETGEKENGVGETGGKTTGVKERGVAETGGKEKGVGETGGKTTGVKERGVGETGEKEKGVGETEGKTTGVKERGVGETRAKEWEVGETGGKGSGQNVMEGIERKQGR